MARQGLSGYGPEHAETTMIRQGAGAPAGYSLPTVTAVSALSPSQGTYFLKAVAGAGVISAILADTITPKSKVWALQRDLVVEGTMSFGTPLRFITFGSGADLFTLEINPTDADTWGIRVSTTTSRTFLADGSTTTLTKNAKHSIRVELNGSTMKVWVDGGLEINATWTNRITTNAFSFTGVDLSGDLVLYWSRIYLSHSDSGTDRPNTDVECKRADGTSDWGTEQDFGDNADCTGTDAVYGDVALDGSDQRDTSIYWCILGGNGGNQMMEVTDLTFTGDPELVVVKCLQRANVGSKTVATSARISDGTNATNKSNSNLSTTGWRCSVRAFQVAPDGTTAWQDFTFSGLKIGGNDVNTNGANSEWAVEFAEVFSTGDDPEVITENRRRVAAQVA